MLSLVEGHVNPNCDLLGYDTESLTYLGCDEYF